MIKYPVPSYKKSRLLARGGSKRGNEPGRIRKRKSPPGARVFGLCEAFADGVRESQSGCCTSPAEPFWNAWKNRIFRTARREQDRNPMRKPAVFSAMFLVHFRAIEAVVLMHGPQLAASAASVSLFLLPDKFVKAVFLNISEVFQHAHMIFCPVASVQRFQSAAGVFCTFEAKSFLFSHFRIEQFWQAFLSLP